MYGKAMAFLAAVQLKEDRKGEVYISTAATKAVITFVPFLSPEELKRVPAEMREYCTLIEDGDQSIVTIQG